MTMNARIEDEGSDLMDRGSDTKKRLSPKEKRRKQAAWGLALVAFVAVPLCAAALLGSGHDNADRLTATTNNLRQLSSGKGSLGGCTNGNKAGMIILYIILMVYLFIGLAIVCDDFFVASLESLSEYFNMSEDVAGATFMAAGSSAPELFTSLVDTFYFESNVGIGTIVGSAVFNILVIIAASAAAAKTDLHIDYRPLLRDIFFYLVSIGLLLATCWPKDVTVTVGGMAAKKSQGEVTEWKAAILVAWYFCYLLFMKYNARLLGMTPDDDKPTEDTSEAPVSLTSLGGALSYEEGGSGKSAAVPEVEADAGKEEEGGLMGGAAKVMEYACAPWTFVFTYTIPNCANEKWASWFPATFLNSCLWIAVISWLLVLCATNFGCLVGLGPIIMGVVFLAAGTSVPDAISSVVVAREGLGGMAVANAIGSNVFDICLGLGIPYLVLIATVCMPGKFPYVKIETDALLVNIIILVGTVVAVLGVLLMTGWKLTKNVGWALLLLYLAFVIYNIVLEATGVNISID